MRFAVFAAAFVLGLSCVTREPCGPSNCTGCCSPLRDDCLLNDPHVCSLPGAACAECDALTLCSGGQCVKPPRFDGPMTVDFGQVVVGYSGATTLTFTNAGDVPLVIRDAGVLSFGQEIFGVTGGSQTVLPHQTGSVALTFTPPSIGGFGGNLFFEAVDGTYAPLVTGSGI